MESLFAPSSYEARIELERQGQKQAPAPVPGDPLHGLHVRGLNWEQPRPHAQHPAVDANRSTDTFLGEHYRS